MIVRLEVDDASVGGKVSGGVCGEVEPAWWCSAREIPYVDMTLAEANVIAEACTWGTSGFRARPIDACESKTASSPVKASAPYSLEVGTPGEKTSRTFTCYEMSREI